MSISAIIIAGTLAPSQSRRYYQSLIDAVQQVEGINEVHFETISKLGLGDTVEAAEVIGKNYLDETEDSWIIIGHSQGGIIASLLAMRYESKVFATVAIASPLAGTTWTDPINMPVRAFVEMVSQATRGRIQLRPKLRKLIAPIPVARNLASHSDISEQILNYLANQTTGHHTYCIIGLADMLVFPHRSAHPKGKFVHNYLIAPDSVYATLESRLPSDITHVCSTAGHMSIVNNPEVHNLIATVIADRISRTQTV